MQRITMLFGSSLAALCISGCTITPNDLSFRDLEQGYQADRAMILAASQPITQPISLSEAISRALKNNLEQRVLVFKQSIASSELAAGKFDMLPKLLAEAGYDWRNNFSSRYEADYSTPYAIDRDRETNVSIDPKHNTYDLGLSWSLLDFGASYYTSKQNADRLLVANEERRRAMHLLIQNVRVAYWKALANQKLSSKVSVAISEAETALDKSRSLVSEKITSPEESLRYQRNLLENLRLLESINRDLSGAKIELSKLMGVLPGTEFQLSEVSEEFTPLSVDVALLEQYALFNNTDLREQYFNVRIAALETRKTLLKMFPNLTFKVGTHYDNDYYMVNHAWNSAGTSLSFNLMNLLSYSSKKEVAEKTESIEQLKRAALQMTTIAKVHLAVHQYTNALLQYQRSDDLFNVDNQLEQIAISKTEGNMAGQQRRISANVTTILSELRRYEAMSKYAEAVGLLDSSIGHEPLINSVDDMDLEQLGAIIKQWLAQDINGIQLPVEPDV
ncbi:TolC family protein [Shewanella avicenniae]|uniref:TolC family protein n=1 Tax=Shewanella avicenniae TaxID=2814294 RepID=A0ABX7QMF3_9GAMM|nr:TolC family protein [Shewanella avicenniae]QSX32637.1 TolC family protein [Shewanella avicenniae]